MAKNNIKVKNNTKVKCKRLPLTTWLTIIGGFIIFISWVVEKNFQANWKEEKEKLKRSQIVIDITETQRANFEIAFYKEIRNNPPDPFTMAFLRQRLTRVYLDLLSWSKGRVTENPQEYSDLIQSKRKIDEDNRVSFIKGDYKRIEDNFNLILTLFEKTYMKLDSDFLDKVEMVDDNEDFWTKIFNISYIVGSLLLGLGYIQVQLKNHN